MPLAVPVAPILVTMMFPKAVVMLVGAPLPMEGHPDGPVVIHLDLRRK
jgi:hypothetical protein